MTQTELNCAIARATGESLGTIAQMGFVLLTDEPVGRAPLVVDWDKLHAQRTALFPHRSSKRSGHA